jgi:DNA repair protein RadA/Sms
MKNKTIYTCQNCGHSAPRWTGKCPSCGEWNTLVEETRVKSTATQERRFDGLSAATGVVQKARPVLLGAIEAEREERIATGIAELDRALGGGIMRGSITLVGGDPGIGKSTLLLQMCARLDAHQPLYVTGEESLQQIKYRAGRLGIAAQNMSVMSETNADEIALAMKDTNAGVVIVDSIQTMFRPDIESAPGSVAQVRECAALLTQAAKALHKPVFLVGHVTKEGNIAGPKVLEHIVDTVLQFEGERIYSYRILRAAKNRYGSTNEIGVFEMSEDGLREVSNPSEVFLSQRNTGESGTAVTAAMEGTRPLLVEVQALVSPSSYTTPQRSATGLDYRRLQMIVAVLEKRLGVNLGKHDVFVNIAGGLKLDDPAIDLAVAAAIVSSFRDIAIEPELVLIGEIGLTGEVRSVISIEQRVSEAQKLGFTTAVIPTATVKRLPKDMTLRVKPADRILKALMDVFGRAAE